MTARTNTKRNGAFDTPPVLTGKRKRATISYVEVEGDVDSTSENEDPKLVKQTTTIGSDEDEDFSVSRKKTTKALPKKKTRKAPKPKKSKSFRFLDLPPELRDLIYEMAFVDPNDVSIVTKTRGHRQKVLRGTVYDEADYRHSYGMHRHVKAGSAEVSPISTTFVPALLAVNKQIHAEAINYLYGHKFTFENFIALIEFLTVIGQRNQQRLSTVRVVHWGSGRGASKLANHCGLTMLSGATNLKALELNGTVDTRGPAQLAKQIFREGYHFVQAYGAANGSKDAAVDIIHLSDAAFKFWRQRKSATIEEHRQTFKHQLRALANTL